MLLGHRKRKPIHSFEAMGLQVDQGGKESSCMRLSCKARWAREEEPEKGAGRGGTMWMTEEADGITEKGRGDGSLPHLS